LIGNGVLVGKDRKNGKAFHFSTPVKPYPSLALGFFETIPLELAARTCGVCG